MKLVQPPTLEQLKELQEKQRQERERYNLAVKLNICPVCGADIISENIEERDKPKKYFFGLFKSTHIVWDYRVICSVNKEHYEKEENYDNEDV